jgi:hypothetical protein
MLQACVLRRLSGALSELHDADLFPALLRSLREIGETDWKTLFELSNVIDPVLRSDPAGAYARMDYDSRDAYRTAVAGIGAHAQISEREIALHAVELARREQASGSKGRFAERRTHVGYYLVDQGVAALKKHAGYRPPVLQRLRDLILQNPNEIYLVGMEVMTLLIITMLLSRLPFWTPIFAAFLFVLLPASQSAIEFMNTVVTHLLPPRRLPKLDFSHGIPADCSTMVAVPTLLVRPGQVHELIDDLEIRYLANRDPNLYFALITDWPDAPAPTADNDSLIDLCMQRVEKLNEHYGHDGRTPFYVFHRHRVYNSSQGAWMGWERKRGKLLDLNRLLRGGFDSFPVKVGNLDVLPAIRYVITLDSDTQLPRDSAHKLVGTLAHPLNQAVIDPQTNMVVEGYGILQPRIGISISSATRSRLAALYSGQTGFDIYTRAVSDVYQDLFGEGIFTGKGIYEVDTLHAVLHGRFPDNWLLSHDLIEGAYARAGLVSDIELIDDYPSHLSAFSRRKHRWVRGDWQILQWILSRVPDHENKLVPNPINAVSRWKILDNVRRSLFDPAMLAMFIAGWVYLPGSRFYWTAASVATLLLPVYAQLLFSFLNMPLGRGFVLWARETAQTFLKGHFLVLLQIAFLLQQAFVSVDAIFRSAVRQLVTRKRLLEWETAAEAEAAERRSTVDRYLDWCPYLALLIAAIVALRAPKELPAAAPIIALWFAARPLSAWLNRAPSSKRKDLSPADERMLRQTALRTWRFFSEHSVPTNNWLIPDSVREEGARADRISPTNLGFLLNARISAVLFGYLSLPEFARDTRRTLERALQLRRYRGHFLNWYDTATLQELQPLFISTVDSGNLAASLWTLKQAALSFAKHPPAIETMRSGLDEVRAMVAQDLSPDEAEWWQSELNRRVAALEDADLEVTDDLQWIALTAHRLVEEMDFGFLYLERKKVLSVGYDIMAERLQLSAYDLIASESRIAAFIAIAKGDLPQDAWFHLGRKHTLAEGEQVLLSWTGTMFEYLMPVIWMRHYRDTLLERAVRGAVSVQMRRARKLALPWGISESAFGRDTSVEYGYAAFGMPELAMKTGTEEPLVISPYSTFLALGVRPRDAMANLAAMSALGWTGAYGFIESVDYGHPVGDPRMVRTWMAHHQGMTLLSLCNLFHNSQLQQCFHAEPQVSATELLLHERVPRRLHVEPEEQPEIIGRAAEASGTAI